MVEVEVTCQVVAVKHDIRQTYQWRPMDAASATRPPRMAALILCSGVKLLASAAFFNDAFFSTCLMCWLLPQPMMMVLEQLDYESDLNARRAGRERGSEIASITFPCTNRDPSLFVRFARREIG